MLVRYQRRLKNLRLLAGCQRDSESWQDCPKLSNGGNRSEGSRFRGWGGPPQEQVEGPLQTVVSFPKTNTFNIIATESGPVAT